MKHTGKPSAGNPHAGFDEAGAGNRLTVWLVRHSQRKRGATARLNLRSRAPVLDPAKTEHQDADSLLSRGRQHGCFAITRASSRSCVVLEPAHAEKQHAREPGDLWSASTRKGTRPVCEGPKPHGGHARSGGVGPRHSIDEPDEQRRAIFGGDWGEKGAGQGEHRFIQHSPDTARGNRVCQGWRGVRGATLFVTHPRWEPYAGKPLVRFCAGGDQRWSSLPQHLADYLFEGHAIQNRVPVLACLQSLRRLTS